jgi:hypothetical protein
MRFAAFVRTRGLRRRLQFQFRLKGVYRLLKNADVSVPL